MPYISTLNLFYNASYPEIHNGKKEENMIYLVHGHLCYPWCKFAEYSYNAYRVQHFMSSKVHKNIMDLRRYHMISEIFLINDYPTE